MFFTNCIGCFQISSANLRRNWCSAKCTVYRCFNWRDLTRSHRLACPYPEKVQLLAAWLLAAWDRLRLGLVRKPNFVDLPSEQLPNYPSIVCFSLNRRPGPKTIGRFVASTQRTHCDKLFSFLLRDNLHSYPKL